MVWILWMWAITSTVVAVKYHRMANVTKFAITCLIATGIILSGSKKYARGYLKVVANQADGPNSPVTRLLQGLRKNYNLPQPRHSHDDLRLIETAIVNDLALREKAVLEESRHYDDIRS